MRGRWGWGLGLASARRSRVQSGHGFQRGDSEDHRIQPLVIPQLGEVESYGFGLRPGAVLDAGEKPTNAMFKRGERAWLAQLSSFSKSFDDEGSFNDGRSSTGSFAPAT